jgi:hypothetical protein
MWGPRQLQVKMQTPAAAVVVLLLLLLLLAAVVATAVRVSYSGLHHHLTIPKRFCKP